MKNNSVEEINVKNITKNVGLKYPFPATMVL